MNEFDLIHQYFTRTPKNPKVRMGVGDDGAIVATEAQENWVFCMDTLVCGRHFPEDAPPESIGYKALAVNLSDLAAMGATPQWFQLALTLPESHAANQHWLALFAQGLWKCADEFGVDLIGGDTTRGALSITIQAAGTRPVSQSQWHRHDAKIGDFLCVTGTLGDAALGLRYWQSASTNRCDAFAHLYQRLHCPTPRVMVAQSLAKTDWVHAAIDVSDGLLAEINHICEKSQVAAKVFIDQIPVSADFSQYHQGFSRDLMLNGGDDYELILTISPDNYPKAQAMLAQYGLPLSHFGVIVEEKAGFVNIQLYQNAKSISHKIELPTHWGFQHF